MTTKAKRKSATAKVERVISDNPGQLKALVKKARGLDAQGQRHHRGVVRSQLLGVDDFANQQDLGCRAEEVRRALA